MAAPRGLKEGPFLIGLGYQKQVGKDTFAGFLEQHLSAAGFNVALYSIAAPLKALLHEVYGIPWAHLNGDDSQKNLPSGVRGLTVRELLQTFGCEMRDHFPGIWSGALERRFWDTEMFPGDRCDVVIIPDVRFRDEFEIVRSRGTTVRVKRPQAPEDPHWSEASSPLSSAPWEFEVWNHCGLEFLDDMAGWMVRRLESRIRERTRYRAEHADL